MSKQWKQMLMVASAGAVGGIIAITYTKVMGGRTIRSDEISRCARLYGSGLCSGIDGHLCYRKNEYFQCTEGASDSPHFWYLLGPPFLIRHSL